MRRFNRELGREVREVTPEAMEQAVRLRLAGQHPRAAERAQAGLAYGRPARSWSRRSCPHSPPARRTEPATAIGSGVRLETLIEQRMQDGSEDLYQDARRELDRLLLPLVLRSTGGNQVQAARTPRDRPADAPASGSASWGFRSRSTSRATRRRCRLNPASDHMIIFMAIGELVKRSP